MLKAEAGKRLNNVCLFVMNFAFYFDYKVYLVYQETWINKTFFKFQILSNEHVTFMASKSAASLLLFTLFIYLFFWQY